MNNILIIGACGVGKTWVMKHLLSIDDKRFKLGKINFHENDSLIIVGKYDGTIFEGSDRLAMTAITDISRVIAYAKGKKTIWEGDRFMNSTFIDKAKPIIMRIMGDGQEGRRKRGSQQSERQVKAISTRGSKITPHMNFKNSSESLSYLLQQ